MILIYPNEIVLPLGITKGRDFLEDLIAGRRQSSDFGSSGLVVSPLVDTGNTAKFSDSQRSAQLIVFGRHF